MRNLKTIAKWINENSRNIATVRPSHANTDRKIGRLRSIGKGRSGFLLSVRNRNGRLIYTHDSAETYRTNREVENWIKAGMPDTTKGYGHPYYA